MQVCSACGDAADEYSVKHRGCGCVTHVECLVDQTRVAKHCAQHDPDAVAARLGSDAGGGGSEPWPTIQSSATIGGGGGGEPRPTDGIDYVLTPGKKQAPGMLGKVASMIPGLSKRAPETVATSQSPEFLLNNHVPIDAILKRNKLGLQHFLKDGVEMIDFLRNGYTWNDLLKFKDISKEGPERALQTLCALKTRANHFRDYPSALPVDKVRAHTGFENRDLCVCFGLTFPDDGPLECSGDQEWYARDIVKLGLNTDDLIEFGLYYTQQYQDLFHNVTQKDMGVLETKLGTTLEHLEGLVDLQQLIMQQKAAIEAEDEQKTFAKEKPAPIAQQQPKKKQPKYVEQYVEEEYVEEMEEPIAKPVRQYVVPIPRPKAAAPAAIPQQDKIRHIVPQRRPGQDCRAAEARTYDRFARHGANLK